MELVNWIGKKTLTGSIIYAYKVDRRLVRRLIGSVEIDFLPYSIHSVAVVGNYLAIVSGPVSLDFIKAGINLCLSCSANDELKRKPTSIYLFSLLPEDEGENTLPVSTTIVDNPNAFFMNHFVNSFLKETPQGDLVVLDMCSHYNMDGLLGEHVLGSLSDVLDPTIRNSMPYFCDSFKRIEIHPVQNKIVSNVDLPIVGKSLQPIRFELASVSPSVVGKPYCFAYASSFHALQSALYEDMSIVKINVCDAAESAVATQTASEWFEQGTYVGEPIFVANPSGTKEDDGALLVMSMDGATHTTSLLVFDAASMTRIAKIAAPIPLMFEFHGRFCPTKQ